MRSDDERAEHSRMLADYYMRGGRVHRYPMGQSGLPELASISWWMNNKRNGWNHGVWAARKAQREREAKGAPKD